MRSRVGALSERWFRAWLDKDPATLERLMAPDYLYVGPNGLSLDGPAILRMVRSPSYRLDHGRRTEIVIRAVGSDAAIVRDRYRGSGSFEGASFTDDQRCVMIWEKRAGEWRLVMEQCTQSGEKPRAPRAGYRRHAGQKSALRSKPRAPRMSARRSGKARNR